VANPAAWKARNNSPSAMIAHRAETGSGRRESGLFAPTTRRWFQRKREHRGGDRHIEHRTRLGRARRPQRTARRDRE
jgi:hypothetical protein